jgi:hypothetical protein
LFSKHQFFLSPDQVVAQVARPALQSKPASGIVVATKAGGVVVINIVVVALPGGPSHVQIHGMRPSEKTGMAMVRIVHVMQHIEQRPNVTSLTLSSLSMSRFKIRPVVANRRLIAPTFLAARRHDVQDCLPVVECTPADTIPAAPPYAGKRTGRAPLWEAS